MYDFTMFFSRSRNKTDVISIGGNSLGCTGFAAFGNGVILVHGTAAAAKDRLISSAAMGVAKAKVPRCRNQAGVLSIDPLLYDHLACHYYFASGRCSKYCDQRLCLSVCLFVCLCLSVCVRLHFKN